MGASHWGGLLSAIWGMLQSIRSSKAMCERKNESVVIAALLVLLLVAGGVGYRVFRSACSMAEAGVGVLAKASGSVHAVDSRENSAGPITIARQDSSPGRENPLVKMTGYDELLAEFELTGDERFLEKAQLLYPDNPSVIFASALLADSPDSDWLKKLEELQPDNSFPNLARAAIYAKRKDTDLFAEELREALSKRDFNTGLR